MARFRYGFDKAGHLVINGKGEYVGLLMDREMVKEQRIEKIVLLFDMYITCTSEMIKKNGIDEITNWVDLGEISEVSIM